MDRESQIRDESVRDALCEAWRQAIEDQSPGVNPDEALDRLTHKYADKAAQAGIAD